MRYIEAAHCLKMLHLAQKSNHAATDSYADGRWHAFIFILYFPRQVQKIPIKVYYKTPKKSVLKCMQYEKCQNLNALSVIFDLNTV